MDLIFGMISFFVNPSIANFSITANLNGVCKSSIITYRLYSKFERFLYTISYVWPKTRKLMVENLCRFVTNTFPVLKFLVLDCTHVHSLQNKEKRKTFFFANYNGTSHPYKLVNKIGFYLTNIKL